MTQCKGDLEGDVEQERRLDGRVASKIQNANISRWELCLGPLYL
jgi:hypothetical protein